MKYNTNTDFPPKIMKIFMYVTTIVYDNKIGNSNDYDHHHHINTFVFLKMLFCQRSQIPTTL